MTTTRPYDVDVRTGEVRPHGEFVNAAEPPPVHVALANVARQVRAVGKSGTAPREMGGFAFRKYDDVVDAIHDVMAEQGVIPIWKHLEEPRHVPWSAKMHRYVAHVEYRFIGPAGDELVTEAWVEALDNGDKGLGKAISYGLKDLLARMLTLPFGESTDNEAPQRQVDEGYERTYDANTVDPPVEELISAEQRQEILDRIEKLTDDQKASLKERWKKLTDAQALRPLQRFRPSDVPVFNDLLKNIQADTTADTPDLNPGDETDNPAAQEADLPPCETGTDEDTAEVADVADFTKRLWGDCPKGECPHPEQCAEMCIEKPF